jgi:hypothetical protein
MAEKMKFKVSIKELSFEYEGTRDVGQALQAGLSRSLAGLMDTQRTVMLPAPPLPIHDQEDGNGDGHIVINQRAQKPKKPRKSSGVSLIGLLRDLKTEKFFAEPRSVDALREKLKTKGHTFKDSLISARLLDLTQGSELSRSPNGAGWLYKDTPFDESAGTTNTADESAG